MTRCLLMQAAAISICNRAAHAKMRLQMAVIWVIVILVLHHHRHLRDRRANPSPAKGATNVATDTDLSWDAASGATSYDVYFGTTSPGTFLGNQAGTTYDTGAMANSVTYYWRIDPKNDQGTTTGNVWSFTTVQAGVPAADYYVDGTNGNDNNTGTSLAQAWATIQQGGQHIDGRQDCSGLSRNLCRSRKSCRKRRYQRQPDSLSCIL